jgi:hypothetical protein
LFSSSGNGEQSSSVRAEGNWNLFVHFDVRWLVTRQEDIMSLGTILVIILIVLLLGSLPTWPYSSGWGYYPSGGFGLVVVILLILLLMGRI